MNDSLDLMQLNDQEVLLVFRTLRIRLPSGAEKLEFDDRLRT